MDILFTAATLFLILDPLGNVPVFLSVLNSVEEKRRTRVLIRELLIAYVFLIAFLLLGGTALDFLHVSQEAIGISGGIILLIIALRMVFPTQNGVFGDKIDGEPLVVPLAVPLIAGPSALAMIMLLRKSEGSDLLNLFISVSLAWAASAALLLLSPQLFRLLQRRGLMAVERLMGMLLIMIAVQMFINGLESLLSAGSY